MTSKEIIKQIIVKLEDELQHYTMVDIDRVKAKYIELEIKDYKQVLQDLERLEALEKENKKWCEIVGHDLCEALGREILLEENEKLKKALFITYMKNVDLELLKDCFELKDYNDRVNFFKELTQQEYELLKEVINNE